MQGNPVEASGIFCSRFVHKLPVDFCHFVMYNVEKDFVVYRSVEMNKLFDLNNPFFSFLSKVADIIILSFLWFVCCLPVFTIGPASSALYYVALKLARKEDVQITSCFFKGFKDNFKQGVAYSFIFVILGAVLVVDYVVAMGMPGTAGSVCCGIFFALGVWLLCTMFYTFPLQAQFYNTVKQTVINAMILAARKFLMTVIVFAVNIVPVILLLWATEMFLLSAPIWALAYPGLAAFVCSMLFVKVFDPMIEAATGKKPGIEAAAEEEEDE